LNGASNLGSAFRPQHQSPGEKSRSTTQRNHDDNQEEQRGDGLFDALEVNSLKPQELKESLEVAFFDHLRETTINHLERNHDDDVVVVVAGMPFKILFRISVKKPAKKPASIAVKISAKILVMMPLMILVMIPLMILSKIPLKKPLKISRCCR
jgi:hypothetical protein